MTEAADKIARRLAPLVQEGIIGGHTVREVSPGRMLVTISPRPNSLVGLDKVRVQVSEALLDLEGVIVEFLP